MTNWNNVQADADGNVVLKQAEYTRLARQDERVPALQEKVQALESEKLAMTRAADRAAEKIEYLAQRDAVLTKLEAGGLLDWEGYGPALKGDAKARRVADLERQLAELKGGTLTPEMFGAEGD